MFDSCARAAKSTKTSALESPPPLAIPHKGRWLLVPACHRLLQPVDHLLSALGMLAGEGAPHNGALQRLGHVEPRAANRRVEGRMPCCSSQRTIEYERCPLRLSQTRIRRRAGGSLGR